MENNLILDRVDSNEIHDYLLFLLETSDEINFFCESSYQILSNYLKLNSFIVTSFSENTDQCEIVYQNFNTTSSEEYLSTVFSLVNKSLEDKLKRKIYFNFHNNINNYFEGFCHLTNHNNNSYFYLLSLQFKGKYIGNLLIDFEKFYKTENEAKKVIILLGKYLAIYLYEKLLEFKQQDLEKQKQKLNQSKENQSEYLSKMNHELRTPISAVIGFAKMLQQQLYGELNAKQAQYVDAIYQSGKYLLDLISDLLDISKIEANKEDLYIEKILVNELCESSLALIKTNAEQRGLKLILTIEDSIKYCYIDRRRIQQVLVNLLSNAVKFTETGFITLDVKEENNCIFFRVIDTGIGISQESQKKLFLPFSQLNTHLHRQSKGSGLGLVISRELAKLHGGDITLISEENKGSCFTLYLPQVHK
ncbi:HAMP domain-containing sensor histidine kinase [Geminocystis sp. NIES-3709]|uniref:sensor histidine kinase n=1 Tax=Geminocystis sp. NIES-3709 TaxID=1617448 RepID=UPI0005FC833B|nr:HAMP domain-containing sensor histidine kinase [Geminocystis sp. NIES-3709]BAQ64974.1 circadian input kinase A [Geminocystis sp. NIES-3709]